MTRAQAPDADSEGYQSGSLQGACVAAAARVGEAGAEVAAIHVAFMRK